MGDAELREGVTSEKPQETIDTTALFGELLSLNPEGPRAKEIKELLLGERDKLVNEALEFFGGAQLRHIFMSRPEGHPDVIKGIVDNNTFVAPDGSEYYLRSSASYGDAWGSESPTYLTAEHWVTGRIAESLTVCRPDFNKDKLFLLGEGEKKKWQGVEVPSTVLRYSKTGEDTQGLGVTRNLNSLVSSYNDGTVIEVSPGKDPLREARRMLTELKASTRKTELSPVASR